MTPHLEASPPAYVPRDPSQTVLYHAVADHLETFLASLAGDPDTRGLPAYVQRELYDRFGSALNLNLHYHVIFLEGVYLDRADQGRTPRFVTGEPPTDADIAALITKISHRVMRKLRQLGYLEAGLDAAVATGYDPLGDDASELARTMAASVQQRIAFGERAGQQVRRMGAGFGSEGERPLLSGPRCASVHGFSLHANTHVPAHRRDQ